MATSQSRRRVYRLVVVALAAALVATIVTATVVGAAGMSAAEALRAFAGLLRHGTDATGDFPEWGPRLLLDIRIPRIVLARGRRCAVHRRRFVRESSAIRWQNRICSESPQVPAWEPP